jgi:hypothetical protein
MANENRYPVSGTAVVPSGDANPHTVLDLRDSASLDVGYLKVEIGGGATTASSLTLYDEESGTASADLDRDVEGFELAAGQDRAVIDDPSLDTIGRDVVVEADGNQDAEVRVTIGGEAITG